MYFVYSIPYTCKRDCTAPKPRQGRENRQNLPVLLAFSRSSGYSVYRAACCGIKRRGHREMTAFTPVDPANPQRETIYTQLKNAIINGDIAPDERIVETKYADIFRVSRTPVREAIRMLEREGLVVYEPRKGAVARPRLTRAELDEVSNSILLVKQNEDVKITGIYISGYASPEGSMAHNLVLSENRAKALDKHDVGAYFRHLDEFNGLLTQSSNMPLLIKLLDQIESYSATTSFQNPEHARFRESVLSDDERRRRALAEHEEIVASLRARDADRLRRVLTAHTANVHEAALQRYGKED